MEETITNLNFLKETIAKFKGEIQKFIADPNYSNANALTIRQSVEELERKLLHKELALEREKVNTTYEMHNTNRSSPRSYLPCISPRKCIKHNSNKQLTENLFSRIVYARQSENRNGSTPKINFMDKEKLLKYSTLNKKFSDKILLDDKHKPVIKKEELSKGLLNMIYKGLIPKNADLTPAFDKDGNPLQLHKNKKILTKIKVKDEIQPLNNLNCIKYNLTEDKKEKDGLFITSNKLNKEVHNEKEKGKKAKTAYMNFNFNFNVNVNSLARTSNNISSLATEQLEEDLLKINLKGPDENSKIHPKIILLFSNFLVKKNDDFFIFQKYCKEKWNILLYLLEHLQKLFKKLNLTQIEVDGMKLLRLASDQMKAIQNKDLLSCITDQELASKGLDPSNPQKFYHNIRELFVVRIQKAFRMFLSVVKMKNKRQFVKNVKKIQQAWRLCKAIESSKKKIREDFKKKYENWKEMMSSFKKRWEKIKNSPRIEIHINSLSFSNYKNCTIEKFSERENCQLNRIIGLIDPNIEIVYISPYILSNEVLAYYFSILQTLGIEKAQERFHLIVPDHDAFPPQFSLAQLLFYSASSMTKLMQFIQNQEAYIVPGIVSKHELVLSMYLQCPILMGDYFKTMSLFTKSGAKRIFEINELAMPISAWDIKNEDEFYSSLAHLILTYPTINIWIFKMDNEENGRGVAYIQIDKIKSLMDMKKEKVSSIEHYNEKFEIDLVSTLKKVVPKKAVITTGKLYRGWTEFFPQFLENRGVIESCPTNSLGGVMGSPAISLLIEPNGKVDFLPTFDKFNVGYFRNFGAISPQRSIPNLNTQLIGEKLGRYLYEQEIFGFVTIEFITFHDGQKILFWAIDLKFGLTDLISCLRFSHFLFSRSIDKIQLPDNNVNSEENKITKIEKNYFAFAIPYLIHPNISTWKMKDLVHSFRTELLVFDLERKSGVVFNLADNLQCGLIGLCGVSSCNSLEENEQKADYAELWRLIDSSVSLLKAEVTTKEYKQMIFEEESRSDIIDLNDVISRIKMTVKYQIKEIEKEKKEICN